MTGFPKVRILPAKIGPVAQIPKGSPTGHSEREKEFIFYVAFPSAVTAAGTVYDEDWKMNVTIRKPTPPPLNEDIPEVEEDEWEKAPDVQAEMAVARGAYHRGETRSFQKYLAERRKRAR